jgi:hypothetical protein
MMKKATSFVLVSPTSSMYPEGTPAVLASPAASRDDLFDHPAMISVGLTFEKSPRKGRPSARLGRAGEMNSFGLDHLATMLTSNSGVFS